MNSPVSLVLCAILAGTPEVLAVSGQTEEATELLIRVQLANEQIYADLRSFICAEKIERFRGPITGQNGQHIDSVSAKISFENGTEHYTEIRQDNRQRASLSRIEGAWSEGEFGTLMEQTHIFLKTRRVLFRTYSDVDGIPAAIYDFEVSERDSPWTLNVAAHDYPIGFRTEVWVSRASGQILQISRRSISIPPGMGISELHWEVKLKAVDLNGRMWLLPSTARYAVLYKRKGRGEWNIMSFSEYRRPNSEAGARFDALQ